MSTLNVTHAPRRDEVILNHMPQVRALALKAYRRCPPAVTLEDLVSAGTVGLIQAVDRYDPRRRTQIKSLAEHRIRGAILDYLRQLDPLSRSERQFQRRRESVSACLEQRLCRRPSEAEIARALQMPVSRYQRLDREASAASLVSLQTCIELAGDTVLAGADPVPSMEQAERHRHLLDAIQSLPVRHQYVIRALLGGAKQNEIALRLGVNESRVSQIKAAAVSKLRVVFGVAAGQCP